MKRLFIDKISIGKHTPSKENMNYIKNVLRYRAGDKTIVFDGTNEAIGIFDGKNIEIIEYTRENVLEPTLKLAIAEIKQARFEWLIEKATELGVSEIFLLKTKFTQNHIRNLSRARKIAIEAARQCGRVTIPKIHESITLNKFIEEHCEENWFFGHINFVQGATSLDFANPTNDSTKSFKLSHSAKTNVGIMIGPEGGFDENENKKLINHFTAVCLSQNVLRAETAALVGLIYILESNAA